MLIAHDTSARGRNQAHRGGPRLQAAVVNTTASGVLTLVMIKRSRAGFLAVVDSEVSMPRLTKILRFALLGSLLAPAVQALAAGGEFRITVVDADTREPAPW